jgi:hypothetical protein
MLRLRVGILGEGNVPSMEGARYRGDATCKCMPLYEFGALVDIGSIRGWRIRGLHTDEKEIIEPLVICSTLRQVQWMPV